MAVQPSEIKFFLSGGSDNLDPQQSLGGVINDAAEVDSGVLDNLFGTVSATEAGTGSTRYRCVYVGNASALDTLLEAVVYLSSTTPSPDTLVRVGVDPAGIGDGSTTGIAAVVPTDEIAPAGVVFSEPATINTALSLGDLAPGDRIGVWLERVVDAGADIIAMDDCVVRVRGIT